MRLRLLAAIPFAAALAVLAVAYLVPLEQRWPIIDSMTRGAKLAALFGCLVAGLSFRRGELLFRGWILLAMTYGLLALRDGVLHRGLLIGPDEAAARWADMVLVVLANGCGVVGAWTMAQAWHVAGVELPGTASIRWLVRVVAVVMAVSIALPSFVIHAPRLFDGLPHAIQGVAAALGDAISLAMLAPVLLTAMGLRGTPIVWPWALLATSMFGWLCYDAIFSVSSTVATDGQALRAIADAFRVLAGVAGGAAGLAQRLVAAPVPVPVSVSVRSR